MTNINVPQEIAAEVESIYDQVVELAKEEAASYDGVLLTS